MTDSATATAVVATGYGGPEVLDLIEVPRPVPQGDEVLVDVRAAGANPYDFKRYSGAFGDDPGQLPMRLGAEVAGVVAELGDPTGMSGPTGPLSIGDEVMVCPVAGGYASQVVADASSVLHKPASLTFEQASGLLLAGATAIHALVAVGVGEDDTLLLHGAAGGVGQSVIQVARLRGARVIGTASESSATLLRELGAEPVAYGPGLLERVRSIAPEGVSCAIDAVGTDEAIAVSMELVGERKRIVTMIPRPQAVDAGIPQIGFGPGADPGEATRAAARLELHDLAVQDRIQVIIAGEFTFAQAAAAHIALRDGHTHGKIVLTP